MKSENRPLKEEKVYHTGIRRADIGKAAVMRELGYDPLEPNLKVNSSL